MDIVENCRSILNDSLLSLDGFINQHVNPLELQQTQSKVDEALRDKNNDLDLILEQQTYVKGLIEKDERAITLRKQIVEDKRAIDEIRRSCTKIAADSLKYCQHLQSEQTRELENFQLQTMKNITDDHLRHTRILAQRDQELKTMIADYEREEKNRPNVLENMKRALERNLDERRRHLDCGRVNSYSVNERDNNITGNNMDSNNVELMTVDEYVPNAHANAISAGQATGSKRRGRGGASGARGGGGARGRSNRGRRGGGRGAHAT